MIITIYLAVSFIYFFALCIFTKEYKVLGFGNTVMYCVFWFPISVATLSLLIFVAIYQLMTGRKVRF